jgi:hypothetical protein
MSELEIEPNKKEYKTPDYVRRAIRNYRKKRYNEDENFRNHQKELAKLNYEQNKEKNIEKIREYKRNYMREYRAKKKAEQSLTNIPTQQTTTNPTIEELTDSINVLEVKN